MNRSDRRMRAMVAVLLGGILLSGLIRVTPDRARALVSGPPGDAGPALAGSGHELHERFQQAAIMLHAGQAEYALAALERVIELAPDLPEARVNAGFALFELSNPEAARDQFEHAIGIRPQQVNAYYGLALALEALGDIEAALGAMRTYVHLADDRDPHMRRAWSAIWEWQSRRDGEAIETRLEASQAFRTAPDRGGRG